MQPQPLAPACFVSLPSCAAAWSSDESLVVVVVVVEPVTVLPSSQSCTFWARACTRVSIAWSAVTRSAAFLHFGSVLVVVYVAWIFATRAWMFVSSFVRRASILVATSVQR